MCDFFSEGLSKPIDVPTTFESTQKTTTTPGLGTAGPLRGIIGGLTDFYNQNVLGGGVPSTAVGPNAAINAAATGAQNLIGPNPLRDVASGAATGAAGFQNPFSTALQLGNLPAGLSGIRGLEQIQAAGLDPFADPVLRSTFERGSDLLGEQFRRQSTGALSNILTGGGSVQRGINAPQRREQQLFAQQLAGGQQDLLNRLAAEAQGRGAQASNILAQQGFAAPRTIQDLLLGGSQERRAGAGTIGDILSGQRGDIGAGVVAGEAQAGQQRADLEAQLQQFLAPLTIGSGLSGVLGELGGLFGTTEQTGAGKTVEQLQKQTGLGKLAEILGSVATGAATGYARSDRRLKTAIKHVGEENGIPIYHFKYKDNPERIYKGVMAQDLLGTRHANKVYVGPDGMFRVDYRGLGIDMERIDG